LEEVWKLFDNNFSGYNEGETRSVIPS